MYIATEWAEHSMTTAEKMDGLDNLESLYSQAVSYIDAITHSSSYYTDAQALARYFTAANDGPGSGLIAATLDGYTAQQIIDAGIPSETIGLWAGSEASIPAGWVLCNGLNGSPDLRDRFVIGAGSHYTRGETGGASTVTCTGTVSIAGHALSAGEIAKHSHGSITDYYATHQGYGTGGWTYPWQAGGTVSDRATDTGSTGSGASHSHTATFTGTTGQEKRPPYYAICYIFKS